MDALLRLTLSIDPDEVVVSVAGEIDLYSGKLLRGGLTALAGSHRRIVVDLREVGFMDSSGLSALTDAWKAGEAETGDVVLGGPLQPMVAKLLEATGLTTTLRVIDRSDAP